MQKVVTLLQAINALVKSFFFSIPDVIEQFIALIQEWAGLLFLLAIILVIIEIVLSAIWR